MSLDRSSLRRGAAELVLIFVGITLALAFENWNAERVERREETSLLVELHGDLLETRSDLWNDIASTEARLPPLEPERLRADPAFRRLLGLPPPPPRDRFWESLRDLCGQAFEGTVVESVPPDSAMEAARLVMHVRSCDPREIRIPFHVGDDRSRTWVLTRGNGLLELRHEHVHEDGTPDPVTQYGGYAAEDGTATAQAFPADGVTADLVPAAATNVWTLEIVPGDRFVYALHREGEERRFRAEFDLARSVETPPDPW